MKYLTLTLVFTITIIFSGCENKLIPLKGIYSSPYKVKFSSSRESLWPKLIEIITSKGLSIKTLDEKAGVITTDNTSFIDKYTWENEDGSLLNSKAFVVCNKYRGILTLSKSLNPANISGQWSFFVKQGSNNTTLEISLANAIGKIDGHLLTVKSTGEFEKSINALLQ
ncbi:MAG TPA: hypothetical protein VJ552_05520 [Sediminibacterium sp.]|nr:hypothetical protein [Sediminibacterium sp.]